MATFILGWKENKMSNYYAVKVDGLFIQAPSKERAIEIFTNKFSESQLLGSAVYVDYTVTKAKMYDMQHMGHPNWPNCDIGGCGDITADIG